MRSWPGGFNIIRSGKIKAFPCERVREGDVHKFISSCFKPLLVPLFYGLSSNKALLL